MAARRGGRGMDAILALRHDAEQADTPEDTPVMAEAGLPHAVAAPVTPAATAPRAPAPKVRDLRLDFFRGVSLIFIFLNHIPDNVVGWLSNSNYGFSDPTVEIGRAHVRTPITNAQH